MKGTGAGMGGVACSGVGGVWQLCVCQSEYGTVQIWTFIYLPGYLPGVATPGADIQWTSS